LDVYTEACGTLEAATVRYLMIGGMGINLHRVGSGPLITTEDIDLLLPLDAANHRRATRALTAAGFGLSVGGEPYVVADAEDDAVVRGVVRARACVRAVKDGVPVDLPLEAAGIEFEACWRRQVRRTLGSVEVRVASLRDIVTSKLIVNRDKDRVFLEAFRDRLAQLIREQGEEPPPGLVRDGT
jgi:hypothetical protein